MIYNDRNPDKVGDILYHVCENIPEMIPIKEASRRTGLSYDWIRKQCLQGRIVHIRAGNKYLVNFGKMIEYLNTGDHEGTVNDDD